MPKLLRVPTREYKSPIMDSHRWDGFSPRADDIIIATYSKSGTTWMQRIVDLLVFQSPEPRPVMSTAPWLDATFFAPVEVDLATLAAQTHRRFVKSHLPFDSVPVWDEVKYIHVVRDGRDACISMHNHQLGFKPEIRQRIVEMAGSGGARPPDVPAEPREYFLQWIGEAEAGGARGELPYFEFENTYWRERRRSNLLFVHYADLKADLEGEMHLIGDFLGIETPAALMRELAGAATFEAMKRDGDMLAPALKLAFDRGAERFLHKGINERWRDVLTPEDVARYEVLAARNWTPAQAAWMAKGRRAGGNPRDLAD
jgi:aryl sulfotransferase